MTQVFLEVNGYTFILCLEVEREQLYLPSTCLPTLWGGGRRGRRQRNFLIPDGAQVVGFDITEITPSQRSQCSTIRSSAAKEDHGIIGIGQKIGQKAVARPYSTRDVPPSCV